MIKYKRYCKRCGDLFEANSKYGRFCYKCFKRKLNLWEKK